MEITNLTPISMSKLSPRDGELPQVVIASYYQRQDLTQVFHFQFNFPFYAGCYSQHECYYLEKLA